MYTNKKRTLIQYLIINIILVVFVFGFYLLFSNSFKKDYQNKYVENFQTLLEERLEDKLRSDYQSFTILVDNNTVSSLNNDIDLNMLPKETPYLSFHEVINNNFTFDGKTYNTLNPLIGDNIGFFEENFYFYKSDVVGIFNASKYFEVVFKLTNALNGFIMDSTGEIYFNSNSHFTNDVLHSYIDKDTNELIEESFFKLEKEVIVNTKLNDEEVVLKFTKLDNFNNLYFAQHFVVTDIKPAPSHYTNLVLILLIVYIVISLSILAFIFYYLSNKNNDVESKRIMHYYNKPYIMFVNKHGKIKNINQALAMKMDDDVKNLSEIIGNYNYETVANHLERGLNVNIVVGFEELAFIPIKARGGYYLISRTDFENLDSPELTKLAYMNLNSNYPNLHKLEYDLKEVYNELAINKRERFTLISLDIKGFRHINKNLKRENANAILKKVAEEIDYVLNTSKYRTNLYTDEDKYIVLIYDQDRKVGEELSKRILELFKKPLEINKNKLTLEFTIAIIDVNNAKEILSHIDVIKHLEETSKRAKDLPNLSYLVYDETIKHYVTFRHKMEKDLIVALENDEFQVFLQPKYNYQTDRIEGFESLVRWDNPNYLKVSPLEYITLAEENGLIVELGNVIKTKTFQAAKSLERYNMRVSLNISPVEIMQQGFIDDFLNEYKKYNFKDNTIIVEVTETAIIESLQVVNEKLKILQKNGILIHLDDFGTGYSTLPYIKDLRFDAIKIDKVYIDYIDTDNYSKAIVNMIISLAKTLNLQVIAEGVEHERQMKELAKLGCYLIQGYLISSPIRIDDAVNLVIDYNVNNTKSFKGGKKK